MAKKKEIRKELEEQLTVPLKENIDLIEEFVKESPDKKENSYRLREFISYKKIVKKALSDITTDDVDDYAEMITSLGWSNAEAQNLISILNDFKDHLKKAYPSQFDINYLIALNTLRDKYPAPQSKGHALNLAELGYIRKILRDNPKYKKHRYVFEVYFQLGIPKNDLQYCTPKYLDNSSETWFF